MKLGFNPQVDVKSILAIGGLICTLSIGYNKINIHDSVIDRQSIRLTTIEIQQTRMDTEQSRLQKQVDQNQDVMNELNRNITTLGLSIVRLNATIEAKFSKEVNK